MRSVRLPALLIIPALRQENYLRASDIEPETSEMPDEGDWTDAQKATLWNVITFSALYLDHGRKDIGMSFHAEVSLMEGIEVPYQTPEQQRRAATVVPPAATWILLAGEKVYELCKSGKDDKGRGFSMGRWALWKEKFGEIATNQELGDDVRDIASKAVGEMEKIE